MERFQMYSPAITALYQTILDHGAAGAERYHAALRARGIDPVPDPARGTRNLYAPNPVLVPGALVETIAADARLFCDALRAAVPDATALLARAPIVVREHFASPEIAEVIAADLRRADPLLSMDCFLVESGDGLDRAYIEWQTVGAYMTLGLWVMECQAEAWPELARASSLTAMRDVTLDGLRDRLRALYTAGIEADPRQGVVLDYEPHVQPTRQEFYAIQSITGGAERGMAVLDPREIVLHDGVPQYRRDGRWLPIRRVYSRLVYSDMVRLLEEASSEQRLAMRTLFREGEDVSWINHPLHFFYGSKADFPAFWEAGLSTGLPECRAITPQLLAAEIAARGPDARLRGYVQKPTDLQGGRAVELDPRVGDLRPGWVLQREILPAASHATIYGARTPEVRIMCLPGDDGHAIPGMVFTRVKAPDVFLSNAGHTARLGIPGTGEGFGVAVYE
jgi:hypothetical protein